MPAPKNPQKYKLYINRLRTSHKGQIPWNKGLTKDIDEKVRKISESQKGRVNIGKHNSLETEIKKGQHLSSTTEFKKGHKINLGKHILKPGLTKYHADRKIKMKCDYCGIEISLTFYRVKNHKYHFCSLACRYQFYSGNHNNKWKGGITPENIRIRHSPEFKTWRESVFKRDNYTCQICGEKGGKLNSHHIRLFAEYPKLRFKIDNGMTFCEKCHKKRHEEITINRDSRGRFTKILEKEVK